MNCLQVTLKNGVKVHFYFASFEDADEFRQKILKADEKSFVNLGETASIRKSEVVLIEIFDCKQEGEIEE